MHLNTFENPQQVDSSQNYEFVPYIVILVWNIFSDVGSRTSLATVWKPGIPLPIVRRCSEGVGKQDCFPNAAGPVHRWESTAFKFQGRISDTVLFCVEANTVYCHHCPVLHWKKPITCSAGHVNPLNTELNSICYLLALLGAHHFLYVSRISVKLLTFRLLMSYIYIWSTYSWCF